MSRFDAKNESLMRSNFRGSLDLEQKLSFVTEGVQRYDESSANGNKTKKLK